MRSELAFISGKMNDNFKYLTIDIMNDLSVIQDTLNEIKKEDISIIQSCDVLFKNQFIDLENLRINMKEKDNKLKKLEKDLGLK